MGVSWEVNLVRYVSEFVFIHKMTDGKYYFAAIYKYNK